MRRLSVRDLMAFVFVSAVGLAALMNANQVWAGIMLGLALGAIATSAMGALILRGKGQYRWAGFAAFSGGYLAAAVGPYLGELKPQLGTTRFLNYVQSQVAEAATTKTTVMPTQQRRRAALLRRIQTVRAQTTGQDDPTVTALNNRLATLDANIVQLQASLQSGSRWRSLLPGAINGEDFLCVGHCLFTLLAGLIGSAVAGLFYADGRKTSRQHPLQMPTATLISPRACDRHDHSDAVGPPTAFPHDVRRRRDRPVLPGAGHHPRASERRFRRPRTVRA